MKYDFITANNELYVVKRKFKIEQFQKVIDNFGPKEICENYHCDKVLRGGDGYFYLVNLVEEAQLIQ
jgi:hypothetical protein